MIAAILLTALVGLAASNAPAAGAAAMPATVSSAPRATPGASATVAPGEAVYDDLERLGALGLLPGEILGLKPLSRAEIARIVGAASRRAGAGRSPAREMLIRLRGEYPELRFGEDQGIDDIRLGAAWTNSEPEQLRWDNHLGTIDARVYPLAAYREGDAFAHGGTFWLQTHHAHNLGRALAFGVRTNGRFFLERRNHATCGARQMETETDGDINLKAAYGRLRLGPAVIQAGRDAVAWGPLARGGFLASSNARPLDMIFISHESPYRLPWVFRHAGPHRAALFVADLGEDRTYPHTLLVGLKASFRPLEAAELGFTETLLMGGEGAPRPTLADIFKQVFPVMRLGLKDDYSDHRFGFDYRFQVWPGRLQLYGELFVDDGRKGEYEHLTAHRTGLFLPALGRRGAFDARLEYTRLPALCYRHGRWATGYALDEHLLGDELGPDAKGLRTELRWTGETGNRVGLELAWEGRDADTWGQVPKPPPADPGDSGAIYRIQDNPTEWRYRADLCLDWRLSPTTTLHPRIAGERVRNRGQVEGTDETRFMAELEARFHFGPR